MFSGFLGFIQCVTSHCGGRMRETEKTGRDVRKEGKRKKNRERMRERKKRKSMQI